MKEQIKGKIDYDFAVIHRPDGGERHVMRRVYTLKTIDPRAAVKYQNMGVFTAEQRNKLSLLRNACRFYREMEMNDFIPADNLEGWAGFLRGYFKG